MATKKNLPARESRKLAARWPDEAVRQLNTDLQLVVISTEALVDLLAPQDRETGIAILRTLMSRVKGNAAAAFLAEFRLRAFQPGFAEAYTAYHEKMTRAEARSQKGIRK